MVFTISEIYLLNVVTIERSYVGNKLCIVVLVER